MAHDGKEEIHPELAGRIDSTDPATFVFDPADYQIFSKDNAVVSFTYITGQLGIVMWNLEPGQWNDYHMHPTTEHLHVVVKELILTYLNAVEPCQEWRRVSRRPPRVELVAVNPRHGQR